MGVDVALNDLDGLNATQIVGNFNSYRWEEFQANLQRMFQKADPEVFSVVRTSDDVDIRLLRSLLYDAVPIAYTHDECKILWEWLDEYAGFAHDWANAVEYWISHEWDLKYTELSNAFKAAKDGNGWITLA